ncbi:MAG: CoA transferase [Dehalococcoidales bacterium]|nr:CoA transferase [Dehalococcoidales bacterium]
MVQILEGIKVLDLSEEISGPYCTMMLGDFGADVVKVEPLAGDWARHLGVKVKGESALFMSLNRNKRSIAVDIENNRGKNIIRWLAREADVLVESLQPGRADALGFGYKRMSRINPGLIYCAISAFGSEGPYKDRAASELEIQAMACYPWYLGKWGEAPVRLGMDAAAISSAQCALSGILSALYYRKKSGTGQKVETSMMDALLRYCILNHAVLDDPETWSGVAEAPFVSPETGYQTKDRPILFGLALSQNSQQVWIDFCKGVGLEDLLEDPFFREHGMRMVGTGKDAQEWKPVIERAFEDKTAEELVDIIDKVGGQAGIFKSYENIFNEPQVRAVEMVQEMEHPVAGKINLTGIPYKFSDTPGWIRMPPPILGQHTDEILAGAGFSARKIADLKREKVIK